MQTTISLRCLFSRGPLPALSWRGIMGSLLLGCLAVTPAIAQESEKSPAQTQVQEAIFQEIYGQNESRLELLSAVVAESPDAAEARWQLGQVREGREWLSIEQATEQFAADPRLEEYAERRAACEETAEAHAELARWCRRQGLEDRERLHWQIVLTHDPQHEAAMTRLGLFYHEGRLVTRQELDAERELSWQLARADREWRPKLATLRRAISDGSAAEAAAAREELCTIDDHWAVPTLESLYSAEGGELALLAVEVLSDMNHPWATESLTRHAIYSEDEAVQVAAIEQLKQHDVHRFVPDLLDMLEAPIEAEFTVSIDPTGSVNVRQWVHRENRDASYTSTFDQSLYQFNHVPSMLIELNDQGGGNRQVRLHDNRETRAAAQSQIDSQARSAASQQSQLIASAEARVDDLNAEIQASNERVMYVLREVTGQAELAEPLAWWQWWDSHNSMAYAEGRQEREEYGWTHEVIDIAPEAIVRTQSVALSSDGTPISPGVQQIECFVAGTPVWTEQGPQPIESIQIGDRVLSQNLETGELAYKIVTGCTVRPPTELVSVKTSRETITTTPGHMFWVNGQGWVMTRELNSGDVLHTTEGAEFVSEIVALEEPAAVFNLIVEDHHNYFVGSSRLLTHDVTSREPTDALVPGLVSE